MTQIPELAKIAAAITWLEHEKQAGRRQAVLAVGEGLWDLVSRGMKATSKATSKAVDAGLSAGKKGLQGAGYVGKKGLQGAGYAGKKGLQGAGWAARQPIELAKDVSKAVPQTVSAVTSPILSPKKTVNYYRNAGNGGFLRNLLRDTAGTDPAKKTSVLGDLGRTFWNPRIPTMRPFRAGRGVGKGQGLSRIGSAYWLGGAAAGGVSAADRFVANQPITADPGIDRLVPDAVRNNYNRSLYYRQVPRIAWSGITGQNQVDQDLVRGLLRNVGRNAGGGVLNQAKGLVSAVPTSGKQAIKNQTVGRLASLVDEVKSQPLMQTLGNSASLDSLNTDELRKSKTFGGIKELLNILDPKTRTGRSELTSNAAKLTGRRAASQGRRAASQLTENLTDEELQNLERVIEQLKDKGPYLTAATAANALR